MLDDESTSGATTTSVMVTGATGFVGRQLVRELALRGVPLRLIVRHRSDHRLDGLPAVRSILHSSDIFAESEAWWESACTGIDMVIHAAWYTVPGAYLQARENLDCLAGTLRLAKGAAAAGVRRIVGIGTCFEYELSGGPLSIGTPLRPTTPYAASKAAAYLALSQWLPNFGVEFTWARLFYLYGEGEDPRRLVPYLRQRLQAGEPAELTSGTQIRDFLDVRDAARQIVTLAMSSYCGPANICSGVPITVRSLAERIADEYGRRDLLRFGARPDNLVDPPCIVGVQ